MNRLNVRVATLVTPPSVEPVSLVEAKNYLKVDNNADDSLISLLISAARRMAEEYTRRSFMPQSWQLELDRFSDGLSDIYPPSWRAYNGGDSSIELPRGPVVAVSLIRSFNLANTVTTVPAQSYTLADDRVLLNSGYSWPSNLRDKAAVEINYSTGYAVLPEPIKVSVLLTLSALYENRTCADLPAGARTLLAPYRNAEAFVG